MGGTLCTITGTISNCPVLSIPCAGSVYFDSSDTSNFRVEISLSWDFDDSSSRHFIYPSKKKSKRVRERERVCVCVKGGRSDEWEKESESWDCCRGYGTTR